MRAVIAAATTTLLVLAGCSAEPEAEQAPGPDTTTPAQAEPTESPIVLGEPFTIAGPNYTANVTIESVYLPERCGEYPNSNIAMEIDVEVESGDGTREVLNTGTIRERDPDGYITRDRTVSTSCGDIDELEARDVHSGDKFRGVRWLQEDVNPDSEILFNTPTAQSDPIAEVFVLDLSAIELADATSEEAGAAPVATSPAATPRAQAEPTVVECSDGTPGPARWSDGTVRYSEWCYQTRGGPAHSENERNSGLYGPNHQELLRQSAEAIAEGRSSGDTQFEEGCRTGNINADTCALAGY